MYILDVTKFYNCDFLQNVALVHFLLLVFVLNLFFSLYFVQHSLLTSYYILFLFKSWCSCFLFQSFYLLHSISCSLYSYTRETFFSFCFSCILFLSFNQTLSHIPLVLHSISQTQFRQLLLMSRAFSFSSTHLDDFFIISFTFPLSNLAFQIVIRLLPLSHFYCLRHFGNTSSYVLHSLTHPYILLLILAFLLICPFS